MREDFGKKANSAAGHYCMNNGNAFFFEGSLTSKMIYTVYILN